VAQTLYVDIIFLFLHRTAQLLYKKKLGEAQVVVSVLPLDGRDGDGKQMVGKGDGDRETEDERERD